MSSERPEFTEASTNKSPQASADAQKDDPARKVGASNDAGRQPATVIVRGEAVSNDSQSKDKDSKTDDKEKPAPKKVSEAKVKMQGRLPALDDDADVGVQKDYVVVRDGKADLAFNGTLVASAGPPSAPTGQWQEYRIYQTSAGKHVFSKVGRNIIEEEQDTHEAEIFDPAPSSVPSKLLRSARDMTHTRPLEWTDAAIEFFGYDPLAKELYRKIGGQFEEHIS